MQAGAHGVLQDLQAAKQHNGQEVVLESWMVEKERWKCRLPDGTCLNVRPSNIKPCRGAATGSNATKVESLVGAAIISLVRPPVGALPPETSPVHAPAAKSSPANAAPASTAAVALPTESPRATSPPAAASVSDGPPVKRVRRGASSSSRTGTITESPVFERGQFLRLTRSATSSLRERLGKENGQMELDGGQEAAEPSAAPKPRQRRIKGTSAQDAAAEVPSVVEESARAPGGRTVEQTYQKRTQLEHILLRPDSYVGSTERQSQDMWILAGAGGPSASSSDGTAAPGHRKMIRQHLDYVPALYKIFDEILVNAADNLIRDPSTNTIRVEIDPEKSVITVWNNGKGLPIEVHREHKCYVPDLVFGQLLTSDNYDDTERKVVGGRNGYGAKLTNIFSKCFTVRTADSSRRKQYTQSWRQNMTVRQDPVIEPYEGEDFTRVTFEPDLARFGMSGLEDAIVAIMRRRAYDVAAATRGRCQVWLDEELLEVHSFEDYVGLFLEPEDFRVCETCNDRWEVAFALTDGSGFQQVSMVNSICTTRGGTHVNYITDQAVTVLMAQLSKHKGDKGDKSGPLMVKPQHIRSHLWVFVNCLIENPAFDSQTKDTLTSKRERFGSTCSMSQGMLEKVAESGILETVTAWSRALGKSELARHLNKSDYSLTPRLFGIPKLEDANKAGTKQSQDCTLIITEGDSAKALAVAGLAIVGRDFYGVFPLRGKLRNVREMNEKQVRENEEIDQLVRILALDATKQYQDARGLRYGSLCVMADQDFDGSHIKGLVINFVQHWFPSLLRVQGFLKEFVTPIVKAVHGDEVHTFFTVPEYESWKKDNNDGKGWKCKYYKGLGTSTSAEAREYFSELENHELTFTHSGTCEDDDLIDMAFNSKRADDRKAWISSCEEGTFVDHAQATLSYRDFVNKELVLFAKHGVERAIPSLVDGLKPGQRKVLYGAFLKKLTGDIKVAQLTGYIAEKSAYHHGEASLQGTVIGMAQTYVGSNNINLLLPSGQFGTRTQGGKDHAAARYIFTRLSPVTRHLFVEDDDAVLEYLSEEAQRIEPRWYCPVIPLVLVNGAEGIGVGWSTSVPNYNPRDVIANVRRYLRGEKLEPMSPWYRGFRGTISPVPGERSGRYESMGIATRRSMTRVDITELPVRRWTQDYKEWLLSQLPQGIDRRRAMVTEFREYHTDNTVHFSLVMQPDRLAQAEAKGFERFLRLRSAVSSTNMFLFDAKGNLEKYETPEEILLEFCKVRLEVYGKRKEHHIGRIAREVAVLNDKARFVRLVVNGELEVGRRLSAGVCADMRRLGLRTRGEIEAGDVEVKGLGGEEEPASKVPRPELTSVEGDGTADTVDLMTGYRYLLRMKLWTLTEERLAELGKQFCDRLAMLEELRAMSLQQLWERDLVRLEQALDAKEAADLKEEQEAERLSREGRKGQEEDGSMNRQCVLVLSKSSSEIKRINTTTWRAKRRGGAGTSIVSKRKGKRSDRVRGPEEEEADAEASTQVGEGSTQAAEEAVEPKDAEAAEEGGVVDTSGAVQEGSVDAISGAFACREFDALLAFTEHGFVHAFQALDVPLRKGRDQGAPIAELVPDLGAGHRITAVITVPQGALKHLGDEFAIVVTAMGMAKRVALSSFKALKPGKASRVVPLEEGDEVRWAHRALAEDCLVLASEDGVCLCLPVSSCLPASSLRSHAKHAIRLTQDWISSCDVARGLTLQVSQVSQVPRGRKGPRPPASSHDLKWAEATEAGTQTRQGFCDDDDSDHEVGGDTGDACGADEAEEEAPSPSPEAEEQEEVDAETPRKEEEDDDDDADTQHKEVNAGTESRYRRNAKIQNAAAAAVRQACAKLSVLFVTRRGLGTRVRMTDLKIGKRKQKGRRALRLQPNDSVAAICMTPSDTLPKQPERPREPHFLFHEQQRLSAQPKAGTSVAGVLSTEAPDGVAGALGAAEGLAVGPGTAEGAGAKGAAVGPDVLEAFNALSEAERLPFIQQHTREREEYAAALERRRKLDLELRSKLGQVLICTKAGSVARVEVSSVDVAKKGAAMKRLIKVNGMDEVCTASLISSVDDDPEQDSVPAGHVHCC